MADECCQDTCPEQADVTVETTNVTIDGAGVSLAVAPLVPADATKRNLTVTVDVAGYYELHLWFVDTPTPTALKSVVVPTNPGWDETRVVTNAAGTYTFEVENPGGLRTWYLCATLGNGVVISDAITIGV